MFVGPLTRSNDRPQIAIPLALERLYLHYEKLIYFKTWKYIYFLICVLIKNILNICTVG